MRTRKSSFSSKGKEGKKSKTGTEKRPTKSTFKKSYRNKDEKSDESSERNPKRADIGRKSFRKDSEEKFTRPHGTKSKFPRKNNEEIKTSRRKIDDQKDSIKENVDKKYSREKSNSTFSRKKIIRRKAIQHKVSESNESSGQVRLNKYIANSGICSRREADELITMGLITVNDEVVSELGYKISPTDTVRYEGKLLRAEKPVYLLMNKPKGYITTTKDPQERKTVLQIIGKGVKERVYPVGRLDRNTTGLLLLTNDGDLSLKLSHPSFKVKKIYKVELNKPLAKEDLEKIVKGVRLEEGKVIVDDIAIVTTDRKTVGLELHIGWNRVVRRLFESLDYEVEKLDRTMYAGLDKKDLPRGNWRHLTKDEIVKLKHFL